MSEYATNIWPLFLAVLVGLPVGSFFYGWIMTVVDACME